jgi:hypothetical protein
MGWSLATRPRHSCGVVQRRPDLPLERDYSERFVQKEAPRGLPNPLVINLLGAICGHQQDLHLGPDGSDFRRKL